MTRTIRALALLALLAAAAIVAVAAAASQPAEDDDAVSSSSIVGEEVELSAFSAYEYLAGEWDVYRHVITSSNSLSYAHSLPSVRWKLEKENGTASSNLLGSAWVNGTEGENAPAIMLRVEMHEPSTGKIQTGVDEDHLNTLAQFQFTQMKGSVPISVGVWNAAEVAGDVEGSRYVLQASSHDRFTVLVTPSGGRTLAAVRTAAAGTPAKKRASAAEEEDDLHVEVPASMGFPVLSASQLADGESFLYVFHRVRVDENKTFFQKYGTMLLLGCMLLVNVYMRSKSAAPTAAAAARRVAAPAPAATAASTVARNRAAAAAQGARIEEITEGSIEVNKKGQ